MHAIHSASINLNHIHPNLPPGATSATILPSLTQPLLSLGQFCDTGFDVILTNKNVYLKKQQHHEYTNSTTNKIGTRNTTTGLWDIPLTPTTHQQQATTQQHLLHTSTPAPKAFNAYAKQTKSELVTFLHAAAFSPTVATWCAAIDMGFFATWPGLTSALVRKHLLKSLATAKGHQKEERQGLRSTRKTTTPHNPHDNAVDMTAMAPTHGTARTNCVYFARFDLEGTVASDQTGRFPQTSFEGNKYMTIMFSEDANGILAHPIKNRSEYELVEGIKTLHGRLKHANLPLNFHIIDNECPATLKAYLREHNIDYQLVPPYYHRQNPAERAIQTFKDHFVAGLSSTNPNFPLYLWDKLIPQAERTLNMLRPCRINPRISADTYLNGIHNYNCVPMAPPGIKVLVHEAPTRRKTWAPHGVEGWYVSMAQDHYRCYKVFVPKTRATRIVRTVEFFPHANNMKLLSSLDAATTAAADLTHALLNPAPAAPFAHIGQEQTAALKQLANIFNSATNTKAAQQKQSDTHPLPRVTASPASHKNIAQNRLLGTPKSQETSRCGTGTVRLAGAPRGGVGLSPVNCDTHLRTASPAPQRVVTPSRPTIMTNLSTNRSNDAHPVPVTPPRVHSTHRTHSNHRTPRDTPQPREQPHLIPPDEPRPFALHRYNLRPRQSALAFLAAVTPHPAFTPRFRHQANSVLDPQSGRDLEYRDLAKGPEAAVWTRALANDLGRLAQGVGTRMPVGTNTIFFIPRSSVPPGKTITYARLVASLRPSKAEPYRVRVTVGGNRLEYMGDTTTHCASQTTTKCLLNSVISTAGARFMTVDIKDFYYGTPMEIYEYMAIQLSIIPQEIISQYKLDSIAHNGMVYVEIRKEMG